MEELDQQKKTTYELFCHLGMRTFANMSLSIVLQFIFVIFHYFVRIIVLGNKPGSKEYLINKSRPLVSWLWKTFLKARHM